MVSSGRELEGPSFEDRLSESKRSGESERHVAFISSYSRWWSVVRSSVLADV